MDSDDRIDLLADLPDEPMPDAVAARLDAVIARLAAERRAGRETDPAPTPDPWAKESPMLGRVHPRVAEGSA